MAGWRGVVAREVNMPGDVSCACHTGGPGAPGEIRKGCCNKGGKMRVDSESRTPKQGGFS